MHQKGTAMSDTPDLHALSDEQAIALLNDHLADPEQQTSAAQPDDNPDQTPTPDVANIPQED